MRGRSPGFVRRKQSLSVVLAGLFFLTLGLPQGGHAADNSRRQLEREERVAKISEARERALSVLQDDERFKDLRNLYPDLTTNIHFSERYNCWIVEFMLGDREIGSATVADDGGRVLEFSVERGEVGDEREMEESETRRTDEAERVSFLRRLRPAFDGASLFWIALVLTILVAGDFKRPFSLRNLDVLSLLAIAPFMIGLWRNQHMGFTAIYIVTLYLFARMVAEIFRRGREAINPNLPRGALAFLLALALAYHFLYIRTHGVDDAGVWSTFGAQHIMYTKSLPYGHYADGDTYGPVLYFLHIPIVALIPPGYSEEGKTVAVGPDAFDRGIPYERIRFTAVKIMAALFDALIMIGLILIGRRAGRVDIGLAAAVVYAVSPYTVGLTAGGLGWISHIFPTAATVFALYWIRRPVVSGLLLAIGAWSLYYPGFLIPLWAGYYWGRRRGMLPFIATVAVFSLLMVAVLLLGIHVGDEPLSAAEKIKVFIENTLGFQSRPSWFGFWAQHPALQFLQPVMKIGHYLFCLVLFFLPRRKSVHHVAALSAAAIIGVQLWKPHAGGLYITWYLPFLILAYFAGGHLNRLEEPTLPEDSGTETA